MATENWAKKFWKWSHGRRSGGTFLCIFVTNYLEYHKNGNTFIKNITRPITKQSFKTLIFYQDKFFRNGGLHHFALYKPEKIKTIILRLFSLTRSSDICLTLALRWKQESGVLHLWECNVVKKWTGYSQTCSILDLIMQWHPCDHFPLIYKGNRLISIIQP